METLERCRTCGATLSPDIEWCGQCYTLVSPPEVRDDEVIVVPDAGDPSILRSGSTAPSLWSKVALTVLVVGFGALAVAWLQGLIDIAGTPAWAFTLFFLVTYAALAVVVLALTWRPGRPGGAHERVIVVDGPAMRESEQRQQALRMSQDPGEQPTE